MQSDDSFHVIKYLTDSSFYFNSIRAQDQYGELPIHIACRNDSPSFEVIDHLVEDDSTTLHISNNDGALPIHLACRFGGDSLLQIIKFFVQDISPGFIHVRDNNGDSPLHAACGNRRISLEVIQFLMEQDSAMLHFPNNKGALPIHVACQSLSPNIKYLVEENGGAATLCARDNDGALPLHTLCQFCGFALKEVEYLIKCYPGALSTRTHSGDLPVTLACRAAAPLQVIYTLVRGDPQIIVDTMI